MSSPTFHRSIRQSSEWQIACVLTPACARWLRTDPGIATGATALSRAFGGTMTPTIDLPSMYAGVGMPAKPRQVRHVIVSKVQMFRGFGDTLLKMGSAKPRVMTSQKSVISPKAGLKTAQNSAKHYKKQVMRAGFALPSIVGARSTCVPRKALDELGVMPGPMMTIGMRRE